MGRAFDTARLLAKAAQASNAIKPWTAEKSGGHFISSPSPIMSFVWEKNAGAFNCTNRGTSNSGPIESGHPLHTKIMRAALNFDDSKLHWAVTVPVQLHKKPCIRHRVKRRFKQAFLDELKASGWDAEGVPLKKAAHEQLNGALNIIISGQDPSAARGMDWKDVVKLMRWTLDKFLEVRSYELPETKPSKKIKMTGQRRPHLPMHKLGSYRGQVVDGLSNRAPAQYAS